MTGSPARNAADPPASTIRQSCGAARRAACSAAKMPSAIPIRQSHSPAATRCSATDPGRLGLPAVEPAGHPERTQPRPDRHHPGGDLFHGGEDDLEGPDLVLGGAIQHDQLGTASRRVTPALDQTVTVIEEPSVRSLVRAVG